MTEPATESIEELDEKLARFESQKRWSDYIRTLKAKAELVSDPGEKVSLMEKAATLYVERSANQAEAIRCYEAILDIDPSHDGAVGNLQQLYERRREWDKLVTLLEGIAEHAPADQQLEQYVRLAELGSQRLRDPDKSIELWEKVLSLDPTHAAAWPALTDLYRRAKRWSDLANAMERQLETVTDVNILKQQLPQLGNIYAEKLDDNAGAIRIYQRMLELDPEDRRAQEQLKRRYVAAKDWAALEDFYDATQKWDELIRVLERAASGEDMAIEDKAELLFKVAELWRDKKERPERGVRAYEQVLTLDPKNARAAEALIPFYEKGRDPNKLGEAYLVCIEHSEGQEKRKLLDKAVGLFRDDLDDPGKAFDIASQALRLDPSDGALQDSVMELAAVAGRFVDVTELFEAIHREGAEGARRHLARALVKVERYDDAKTHMEAMYDEDPRAPGIMSALTEVYERLGDHQALMSLCERELDVATDPEDIKALLLTQGRLREEELHEPAAAIESYERVINDIGLEAQAVQALERLYRSEGRWEEEISLLERRVAEVQEPAARHELMSQMANLLASHDQVDRALELHRAVLEDNPEAEVTLQALDRLMSRGGSTARAAAELVAPFYEERAAWQELNAALQVIADGQDDPHMRADTLNRRSQLVSSKLENNGEAFALLKKSLELHPQHPDTLAQLEVIAVEDDLFQDLSAFLKELAEQSSNDHDKRTLWLRAAQIEDVQLDNLDSAVEVYQRLLTLDPSDLDSLRSLENMYRRSDRWSDLQEVLRRRAELTMNPEEQVELLTEVARTYASRLDDGEGAIRAYRRVLEVDVTHPEALTSLTPLLEQGERYAELADNLEQLREVAEAQEKRVEIILKLAALRRDRLASPESAVEHYREVLEMEPGNAVATESLESLLVDESLGPMAAAVLETAHRQTGADEKLAHILEHRASSETSNLERARLWGEAADLYETTLNRPSDAVRCLARALEAEPNEQSYREGLERVADKSGDHASVAKVYEALAGQAEPGGGKAKLFTLAGNVCTDRLGDRDRAMRLYEQALEVLNAPAEGDTAMTVEVVNLLIPLYRESQRFGDLAPLLERKAVLIQDPFEQTTLLSEAASLFQERLNDNPAAVSALIKLIDIDPTFTEAYERARELLEAQSDWNGLLSLHLRRAEATEDLEQKCQTLLEVGQLYRTQLSDADKAAETFVRVLDLAPDNELAMAHLCEIYRDAERWDDLVAVLERRLDLAMEPHVISQVRLELAQVLHGQSGETARALELLRDVTVDDPGNDGAVSMLTAMLDGEGDVQPVADVLEPVFLQRKQWENLIRVMRLKVEHTDDPLRKVEGLERIAGLQELELERADDAFQTLGELLQWDSEHEPTHNNLERLAEQTGGHERLARLYDERVEHLKEESPDMAVPLAVKAAVMFERAGELQRSAERYQLAHQLDPSRTDALASLERIYESQEAWNHLAAVLEQEAQAATSPDDVLGFRFKLGRTHETHLNNPQEAIQQYSDILASAPEHDQARAALEDMMARQVEPVSVGEVLEPIYRANEDWSKLVTVYETQCAFQRDRSERVRIMGRIADIGSDKLLDADLAFLWKQRAVLEDPADVQLAEEAERLADSLMGWEQLASTYATALSTMPEAKSTPFLCERLVHVYQNHLDDEQRTEHACRYLLGVDGDNELALQSLDRIYDRHQAHEGLCTVLKRRVESPNTSASIVELSFRLAATLEHSLGRTEEAIRVYSDILTTHDREHLESIQALQRIFIDRQDWPRLFESLERELAVTLGDTAQADILAKLAHVAQERLADPSRASSLWKRVLDLRGEDREALNALGDLYAAEQNWRDLVDVLDREANVVDDDEVRMRIQNDLGHIWYEKLGRERNAIECWERVLDIDPARTDALMSMATVYEKSGQYHELVDTLRRMLDVSGPHLELAELEHTHARLGYLYAKELQQPMDAVDSFQRALEINPANMDVINSLEHIHRQEEQWEDCVAVLEKKAEALQSVDEKLDTLRTIAGLYEQQLEQPERAIPAYEGILSLDEGNETAFAALEVLHTSSESWEELIGLYLDRYGASDDLNERTRLLRRAADIYETKLEDRKQAFEALKIAWSEDLGDPEILEHLERITALVQGWNDLLSTANEQLQGEADEERRIALCLCCARWYGQRLSRPDYAIPYYQQVLTMDPSRVAAMRQMAEMYRSLKQWEPLTEVLVRVVEMSEDARHKADTLVEIGELCLNELNLPEKASGYYQKALQQDSNNVSALQALERIHEALEDWDSLMDVLQRRANTAEDPSAVADAKLRIAEVLEDRYEKSEEAVQWLVQVRELDEDNAQALQSLERLYGLLGQWSELLEVLEARLERASSERERIELHLRIGKMWAEEFLKPERAIDSFESALDIDVYNEEALTALEQIYRQLRRWDDVLRTYERHIEATTSRVEQMRLHKESAEVLAADLNDVSRAIDELERALDIDGSDAEVLQTLMRMQERDENYSAALDTMQRAVDVVTDRESRVEILFQMGRLLQERMGDHAAALDRFESALDEDPRHLPSLRAVRTIQMDAGEWLAASRAMEREADVQGDPADKAEILADLGLLHEQHMEDRDAAVEYYTRALEFDKDSVKAALPLGRYHFENEAWESAFPLLQLAFKSGAVKETSERHLVAYQLGYSAFMLGEHEASASAYERAHQLDSTHLPTIMGVAKSHYALSDWDKAYKYYQTLLVHHRESLDPNDTTEIFFQLGSIKRQQGDHRKALNMFDKALEQDRFHQPTLEAVIAVHEAQQEWEQVIHYKRQLVDVINNDELRFVELVRIGDLWNEQIGNSKKAVEAYQDALDLRAEDQAVLHKLLVAYQSTRRWEEAIDVIQRISDLDERKVAKAKYAYTVGVICRDELKDIDRALQYFDASLDIDPTQLKAFEAINKVFTQKKDWKQLERAFRKMLHRVVGKGETDLEFNLWHNLGVIYRDRQAKYEAAAEAFKMASTIKPEEVTEHQILAEIYAHVPGQVQSAIEEHQWLLREDPNRVESYQALYRLYFDARAYDKAWCLASTLTFLGKGDEEHRQFYEQYKPKGLIRPRARLNNELWMKELFHEDQDLYLSKIFETVAYGVHGLKVKTDKALKLAKKHEVDTVNSTVTFARTFGFAAQVLNLNTMPRLFMRMDSPGGLAFVPGSSPPASVCGSTLLSGFTPQDLAFVTARHLSYYRGEHFVRTLLSTHPELTTVLLASLKITGVDTSDPAVEQTAKQMQPKLNNAQLEALRGIAKRFVAAGARADMKRWLQSVELTACRAGFLMANDLSSASRMIQSLPPEGPSDVSPKEKIQEVVLFSVSEKYFRLREALGIQVEV